MKYFTADEARAIMAHGDTTLCTGWGVNPALDQAQVLHEYIATDGYYQDDPFSAAVCGFVLGRATGIREERQKHQQGRRTKNE